MYGEYNYDIMKRLGLIEANHFTEEAYIEAVNGMINEDGTKGPHYTIQDVERIIKEKKDFQLGENNLYDYAYVLNMVYSDYYGAIENKEEAYVKVADAFIFDEDGPNGKALKYYLAMKGIGE